MAAKRTHELIPFCHPLALENCNVDIERERRPRSSSRCEVSMHHRTGVEMEALTGASVAALTIYDMCKALSHDIEITGVRLLEKSGGERTSGDGGSDASRVSTDWCSPAGAARACSVTRPRSTYHGRDRSSSGRWSCSGPRGARPSCRCATISRRPARARFERIVDRANIGPIAGHPRALAEHPRVAWLVLACDLPFLDAATLDTSWRARDPSAGHRLPLAATMAAEPLCAIYEPQRAAMPRTSPPAGTARANF